MDVCQFRIIFHRDASQCYAMLYWMSAAPCPHQNDHGEWVKGPLASLQFTACERKVIRVIVTSTMTKLGQCNPHPLHYRQGWKRKKREGEGWGCHHQTVCKDMSMGTLERGSFSLWVGMCVVLEQDDPHMIVKCSFLPRGLWLMVSCDKLSPVFSL